MNTMNFKRGLAVMVFCLGIAGFSNAQGQRQGERKERPTYAQLLKEMDANEDGKLAKSEIKGLLKESFAKIDTDEDGFISEKEFEKAPKPQRRERRSN